MTSPLRKIHVVKILKYEIKINPCFFNCITFWCSCSQDSSAIDSVKKILTELDERNLQKILSFKTADFHAIGPDGKVLDHISMKEYSRQFITNNIPPYTKNTILNLRLSENKIVAVVDVLQESTKKKRVAWKSKRSKNVCRSNRNLGIHR